MSSNKYTVTLVYKENIVIKIEGATDYSLLPNEYEDDKSFPSLTTYSMPISGVNLKKVLLVVNTETKTLSPVNLIIFKLDNGEQAVSTKDLLSISIIKN